MAAITKAELRTRILESLGVLAAGETATAEDAARVDASIDAFFGDLSAYGTPSFATSSIPEFAQDAMRDCVAFRVAATFGIPSQRLSDLATLFAAGWGLLTRQSAALAVSATKTDLRNKVLAHLAVIKPGELSPAAFTELVEDTIDHVFDWFGERVTLSFAATSIPDWAMPFLRDVVAGRIARSFNVLDPGVLAQFQQFHDMGVAELDKRANSLNAASTLTQLRNAILQHLGVLGASEIATPGQIELVEDLITRVFSQLQAHALVTFATTAIPGWAMTPLRDYIACKGAMSLRVNPALMPQLMADSREAYRELCAQQSDRPTSSPVEATYF